MSYKDIVSSCFISNLVNNFTFQHFGNNYTKHFANLSKNNFFNEILIIVYLKLKYRKFISVFIVLFYFELFFQKVLYNLPPLLYGLNMPVLFQGNWTLNSFTWNIFQCYFFNVSSYISKPRIYNVFRLNKFLVSFLIKTLKASIRSSDLPDPQN